jgi:hypothetical protein
LIGLLFNPEDGGDMFLATSIDIDRTTRRYFPEEKTLLNIYRCEKLLNQAL